MLRDHYRCLKMPKNVYGCCLCLGMTKKAQKFLFMSRDDYECLKISINADNLAEKSFCLVIEFIKSQCPIFSTGKSSCNVAHTPVPYNL